MMKIINYLFFHYCLVHSCYHIDRKGDKRILLVMTGSICMWLYACMFFFFIMRFAFTFILETAVKTLFRLKMSIILVEVNT